VDAVFWFIQVGAFKIDQDKYRILIIGGCTDRDGAFCQEIFARAVDEVNFNFGIASLVADWSNPMDLAKKSSNRHAIGRYVLCNLMKAMVPLFCGAIVTDASIRSTR
jgi:hypothetical protein